MASLISWNNKTAWANLAQVGARIVWLELWESALANRIATRNGERQMMGGKSSQEARSNLKYHQGLQLATAIDCGNTFEYHVHVLDAFNTN